MVSSCQDLDQNHVEEEVYWVVCCCHSDRRPVLQQVVVNINGYLMNC